jgi:hypothetical protein
LDEALGDLLDAIRTELVKANRLKAIELLGVDGHQDEIKCLAPPQPECDDRETGPGDSEMEKLLEYRRPESPLRKG